MFTNLVNELGHHQSFLRFLFFCDLKFRRFNGENQRSRVASLDSRYADSYVQQYGDAVGKPGVSRFPQIGWRS